MPYKFKAGRQLSQNSRGPAKLTWTVRYVDALSLEKVLNELTDGSSRIHAIFPPNPGDDDFAVIAYRNETRLEKIEELKAKPAATPTDQAETVGA